MTTNWRILKRDDMFEIYVNNTQVGYIDEHDQLFAIDKRGYAILVCSITHHSQAISKLKEWKNEQ